MIKRLFSYRHLYQALGQQPPSATPQAISDTRANMITTV